MKKNKLTKNQIAFKKQVTRIKNFIRRATKRGYEFSDNVIPTMPKRVTKKSIEKIKNIKPKDLYSKASYLDKSTGEMVSGSTGRKIERNLSAQKAKETRKNNNNNRYSNNNKRHSNNINNYITYETVIMKNFYDYIKSFTSYKIRDGLFGMIKTLEHEQGRTEVAKALQNMPLQFHEILARCGYDSDKALMEFETSFLEYFPNVSEQYKKDLMEKLEYNEMGYEEYED